jgi:hypothetical protein
MSRVAIHRFHVRQRGASMTLGASVRFQTAPAHFNSGVRQGGLLNYGFIRCNGHLIARTSRWNGLVKSLKPFTAKGLRLVPLEELGITLIGIINEVGEVFFEGIGGCC